MDICYLIIYINDSIMDIHNYLIAMQLSISVTRLWIPMTELWIAIIEL